ncbi:MAG TPA: hypothetical protein VGB52_00700 [Actinomycetota bacterium]
MEARRVAACLLLGGMVLSGVSFADPVEVSRESAQTRSDGACATWVEPFGAQYEWTTVCGAAIDSDGDGVVEERSGIIWRDICDEDGSSGGSWCDSGEQLAEGSLSAEAFTVDLQGGTAGLHADLGTCRVDLDWNATGEARTTDDPGAQQIDHVIGPPAAGISLRKRDARYTSRDAEVEGHVCPEAEVSGQPSFVGLFTYETTTTTTSVRIDPAG